MIPTVFTEEDTRSIELSSEIIKTILPDVGDEVGPALKSYAELLHIAAYAIRQGSGYLIENLLSDGLALDENGKDDSFLTDVIRVLGAADPKLRKHYPGEFKDMLQHSGIRRALTAVDPIEIEQALFGIARLIEKLNLRDTDLLLKNK